ncbi:CHC2 zinc finger domain-containing protein [Phenylobacterium sp.]|uniref:DUF7146 domain-containing protein n=1 Tax=Phenylobacterium sp. TaxID=1871053 RepID=UPI0035B3A6AD
MTAAPDPFELARSADIEAVAGEVRLFRAGQRMRGECPICGASKGKRNGGAFSIDPEARTFHCFACGEGGDVIRLEQLLRGGSLREAAGRLAGTNVAPAGVRAARPPPRPRTPADQETSGDRMARALWREAAPTIAGTLAATYLQHRGIAADIVALVGRRLRFHPSAPWGWSEERRDWVRAPAMLARVDTSAGPTGGLHATYLAPDGRGKARLEPAKRMWGRQAGRDGRPGGAWLIGAEVSAAIARSPLVVGEGIESTLSAVQLQGRPCRAVAALSLGHLQGGALKDRWGRIDPAMMSADPEAPAFTWPDAGEVLIAVDRDMSPIEVKVRAHMGGTLRRRLSADERARICAGLAIQHWRAAGASAARAIAPAAGRDFNVELQERLS